MAGFDAVGIAAVDSRLTDALLGRLDEWLGRQYHATMHWMSHNPRRRADPGQVLPGCRSIICVGMTYETGHRATEGAGYGRIARYAWGRDYHVTLGERLKRLEDRIAAAAPTAVTKSYVDTGPIMEKAWAQRAGIGWIGKHSNLVSHDYGSWLVLGEILTTLELIPDEPATDLCGSCQLCIRACPTGAIAEPYVVDARRCISYLTIEHRGPGETIPDNLKSQMGNHIFGCDDCLDACPFNLRADQRADAAFVPSSTALAPRLDDLAELTQQEFADRFRNSPVKRAKWEGLRRNIAIARENEAPQSGQVHAPLPSLTK